MPLIYNRLGDYCIMLFKLKYNFQNTTSQYVRIISEKDKFGIKNQADDTYLIPLEYDNIFLYDSDTFILHQKGKIGACRLKPKENETSFDIVMIAECNYDTFNRFGYALLFTNNSGTRYYSLKTKEIKDFSEVIIDTSFLYCHDNHYLYIINIEIGKIIEKRPYKKHSCYRFCGNSEYGAAFCDAEYSSYLYPDENGYRYSAYILNYPIVVNGQNVANIITESNKLGVMDSQGNLLINDGYDKISVSLKITAIKENEKLERIIPMKHFTFSKDNVSDIDDWI